MWTAATAGGPAVILIAILLIYGIPKYFEARDKEAARDKEIQKVAAELAKEGPVMVIAELRTQIAKLEDRCARVESKHEACEAETSSLRDAIEDRDAAIMRLEKRVSEQDGTIALQQAEITELREQIKSQVGDWKLLKKDVQAVQKQQDQQG